MEAFPAVIDKELDYYLPFLSSTTFLMEAVKAGAGREEAHEAIKEHSVAAVLALRNAMDNAELDLAAEAEAISGPLGARVRRLIDFAERRTGVALSRQEDMYEW